MAVDAKIRRGDIVCFATGSNEYLGEVKMLLPRFDGLLVLVSDPRAWGTRRVAMKNVLRIEEPMLTEKEAAAIHVLVLVGATGEYTGAMSKRGDYVRRCERLRNIVEAGHAVSAKTLTDLSNRGLVEGVYAGINSGWTHVMWGLSEEGRRVAREQLDLNWRAPVRSSMGRRPRRRGGD